MSASEASNLSSAMTHCSTIEPPASRIRAPQRSGEIVSIPPLGDAAHCAAANASLLSDADCQMAGRSLAEFRDWTRQACLDAAGRWMSIELGMGPPSARSGLLFVTGHQPEFIHPGVWMKNIAVATMAERSGGVGLNLIVDNDTVERVSIRVPSGTRESPSIAELPFDSPQPRQPWEELQFHDRELFRSFGERVAAAMRPWGVTPLLTELWPAVVALANRTGRLATCLTACRVDQERRWGLANWELPVSEVCRTEPFLAFVAHLCRHHERFAEIHNRAVREYRQRYHIRNGRHPVPELVRQGDRWELPFWYWSPGARDRRRVFVRRVGAGVELWADDEQLCLLPGDTEDLHPLKGVQETGRLRTRALTTTLFARLGLADLFVHGIGGAKYDEITNGIMREFFKLPAPSYLTLSATLHLPLNPFDVTAEEIQATRYRLRDLQFNADRYVDGASAAALAADKQRLIDVRHSGMEQDPGRQCSPRCLPCYFPPTCWTT